MKSLGVSFKPYYNWNTFNTSKEANYEKFRCDVLNLIITGIPSIQKIKEMKNNDREF